MKINLEVEKLIAKYLLGDITGPEKELLDNWIKSSPQHEEFFNHLRTNTVFRERYQAYKQINSHHAWKRFQKKYCPTPIIIKISSFLKYAAILLLPILLVAGGWYFYSSTEEIQIANNLALGDAIHPGIPKATLTTTANNKQSVTPASMVPVQVSQSAVAIIQNDTLVYTKLDANANTQNEKKQKSEAIENNTLTTDQGNEFKIVFEDGTTVHLNYNTEIRYPVKFGKSNRIVYLKGEAYFKVAKDSRPFYVITNEGKIKQYGTEFNVNTFTPQRTEVALVKGSISITPKGSTKEQLIQPGQLAHADLDCEAVSVYDIDLTPYIAWNEGRLIFENRTLESIVEILEHWYNVNISFGSPELKQLHFTGNMDRYDTITPILKAIARTTNLHIQIKGKEILITGN